MNAEIYLQKNTALAFSKGHKSTEHAHYSLQLTLGLESDFVLLQPKTSLAPSNINLQTPAYQSHVNKINEMRLVDQACFAPGEIHHIPLGSTELGFLFVNCSPRNFVEWQTLGNKVQQVDLTLRQKLLRFRRARSNDKKLAARLACEWRQQCLPGLVNHKPHHRALFRAIEIINASPLDKHTHVTLAQQVNLSSSRFAHIFSEQMGMPVRNYLLWQRLLFALSLLQKGKSITTVAYTSGFSDCAHLSRSFREVFGATPTNIRASLA